jgi:hypothetical protein
MNRKVFVGIALFVPVIASAQVLNGDFETPLTVDASGPGYYVVNTGDNVSIGGWTSGGRAGDVSVDVVSQAGFGAPAYSGDQFIDLAGTPGPGSIFQDVATVPSLQYTLTFAASSNGGPQIMDVYWDGGLLDAFVAPAVGTWDLKTYTVTASGPLTSLGFGSDIGNGSNAGPFLDAVSLAPVPEPASMTALALGAVALIRKRRKA